MDKAKKNRMRFESIEPEDNNPSVTQYETEEYTVTREKLRSSNNFLPIILFILVIGLIGLLFWVWYQLVNKRPDNVDGGQKNEMKSGRLGLIDGTTERPYLPESSQNPKLARCVTEYKERLNKKALTDCTEFINSPGSDEEKSLAYTVIGVIHDDKGMYSQAIENFRQALNYDAKNIYAYYDLALAYRHSGQPTEARNAIKRALDIAPNDPRVKLLAGNLLNDTDPKAAIEIYKQGISTTPNDPYLVYNLALSQYKQGNVVEAIDNFNKAIQVSNGGQVAEFAHAYLGSIYYHREDLNGAEHHFREALVIKPNDGKYLYNLGLILLKKKKTEEAVAAFQKALDSGATDPQIFRYIAESFEDLKMYDNAIVALEKAIRVRPDDLDTMFQLADLYYERGNLSGAEEIFRKIVKMTPGDSNTENALVNLGIIMDDMERYSEAVAALEEALKINPNNDKAWYNLGIAYKNSGQPTKAIECWKEAAKRNPSEIRHQEAVGDYYYENGYYIEAVAEFDAISKSNPYNYRAKLKLADAHFQNNNMDMAEKNLIYVLNNSKDSAEIKMAHRKLALVYSAAGGKNKSKAKDEAYRGSHIDPDDMESRLVLAKILIDSNSPMDREKAIDELTAILRSEANPKTHAQAYNFLGLCYFKNHEFKKALREFQNAIDLDPTLTDAYENKRAARASYETSIQGRNEF